MNLHLPGHHAPATADMHTELPVAGPRRRPHWINLHRVRTYSYTSLIGGSLFILIYLTRLNLPHAVDMSPMSQDFTAIWSAAWLAVHGHAATAWDPAVLRAIEERIVPSMHGSTGALLWLYPPHMLLLVSPLGWLPFVLAAMLWLGTTYAMFVAVIRGIVQHNTAALCAVAFPAALVVVIVGQTSLFTAAIGGLGLLLLQRRPALAGICFAILTVKPQFAVLFPFALLCSGQWRALVAWTASVAGIAALATLAFGIGTWISFAHGLDFAYQAISVPGHAKLDRMPTVYSMVMLAGLPRFVAQGLQTLSGIAAFAAVGYAWRGSCAYSLRAATLACASLLVSPYLYDYDLTWLGLVIAWYARHALAYGWRRFDREWLTLLWVTPVACLAIVVYIQVQFVPLITLGSLALLVARIAQERRASPCLPDAHDVANETEFAHAARPHRAAHLAVRLDRSLPLGGHR
ncbi:glycosyltransferase family 87 protein [Burkholderia guangdongensis]|uniref:glycosyltransferase family 87 protein n=1 Tax=Burkholderia guangdongensis TaxID=1792500 RepID=UPI0015CDEA2A|nr:glycosyltransferase family 87 protein [Burkholderia guangdongensis]